MKASEFQEVLPSLLTRLTTDLSQCLGCRWAVAMSSFDNDLLPLFSLGENAELERCIAHVQATTRTQGVASTRYWYEPQHAQTCPWLPVAMIRILIGDEPCVLAMGPKQDGTEFHANDHALISEFAAHVANMSRQDRFSLIVAGRIVSELRAESDLDAGREIESRRFPHVLTPVDGLDYYGECQPVAGVGGDFFDLLPGNPSSLTVSIGDVSGKGVPAAIITAGLQASLRALAPLKQKLSALVGSLNHMVWDLSPTGFFTTMFYGTFDLMRQELHYVNAGHQAPLLIRAKRDRVVRLDPNGSVLGLASSGTFRERTVALQPGDLFVALTDGVAEGGEDPGSFERVVIEIVRENRERCSSLELARKILAAAPPCTRHGASPDDKTVVVVRLKEEGREARIPEFCEEELELCAVAAAA